MTSQIDQLKIEIRSLSSLQPYPRNARTHSKKQIQQIAASIRQFGFTNPVLIDEQGVILAGHGRAEAAKLLGWSDIPTIRLAHMTATEKRAYILADNRIAESAGWDSAILEIELQFLLDDDLSFDIEVTGFETAQIDLLIGGGGHQAADPKADLVPDRRNGPPVSRIGDLWHLGPHRLLCADARDAGAYKTLLRHSKATIVFTDPPYNMKIAGGVSGLGRAQHPDFIMAAGEMSSGNFKAFLEMVLGHCADASVDSSIHFVCMDWRHIGELLAAGAAVYSELKNLCVWNKDNAGMGSFYRSKHELVFVFKNGTRPHINNFGLGDTGRYRTNVWDYAGLNSMKRGRDEELAMHPTVKPVALVADALKDCSKRNQIVLDPFVGSGTTLVAAEKTGRIGAGLELDPQYIDVTIDRFERVFAIEAELAATGKTYREVASERGVNLARDNKRGDARAKREAASHPVSRSKFEPTTTD